MHTLAIPGVALTSRNKKVYGEGDVTPAAIGSRPDTGLTTHVSNLSCIHYTIEGLMEEHFGLDFFPFLNMERLYQLAISHDDITKKLRIIEKRSLSKRTSSSHPLIEWKILTFISMTFGCHSKHSSVGSFASLTEWTLR